MSEPTLSVVIPGVNSTADAGRTLAALDRQRADVSLEILFVNRIGPGARDFVGRMHPHVHIIDVPATTTIPAMRRLAFDAAGGEYVAVIEDHITVPAGWAKALVAAGEEARRNAGEDDAVVGGPIENGATARMIDWAAFLCEYSHCIMPLAAGATGWLPGNNVVYPRELLLRYAEVLSDDRWEDHLHERMRRDGVTLVMCPDAWVAHEKYYTVGEYVSQRYLYARSYAGARASSMPLLIRIAYGAVCFALPGMLFERIMGRLLVKGRYRMRFLACSPLITIFVIAWGFGEMVGAWFGAGRSLERVR